MWVNNQQILGILKSNYGIKYTNLTFSPKLKDFHGDLLGKNYRLVFMRKACMFMNGTVYYVILA